MTRAIAASLAIVAAMDAFAAAAFVWFPSLSLETQDAILTPAAWTLLAGIVAMFADAVRLDKRT